MESQNILKRLEEQKLALDQSAIVAQTDARGVINYVNDKFCEISEYSREELIGKSHRLVNSGYHGREFFVEMWRLISRGEIWRGEVCNRAKSGKIYWVYTTIVPFLDDAGRPRQYMAVRQDITELKQAQQKILEQQEQLVTNSRLSTIGEMSAAITHEINNPLGVILGRCEMLKSLLQKGLTDTGRIEKLVDAIEINGRRIDKIVRSMRTMAHEGADDPLLRTPVSELLQDALDLTAERIKNHGVRLKFSGVANDLFVDCRSHEVLQVLVNLINNAFDAVLGYQEKWIALEAKDLGSEIEFLVIDSGPGISDEISSKMFDPFFSTKKVQYGTGLGLSISRNLIAKHGGQLELIRQAPNTTFRILLPKAARINSGSLSGQGKSILGSQSSDVSF